jgi:uncharacterized membrane protein
MTRSARRHALAPRPQATAGDNVPLEHDFDFERLLFFSDAVFAIAITLLIIEVRLPALPDHATDDQVRAALSTVVPEVFAYAVSFATIGLYWLAHWRRYRDIERVNEPLVGLNLLLLALVAFIPFPTAMMGEHGDLPTVVAIYAVSLSAAGIVSSLTWVYAWRAGLVRPGISDRYARLVALRAVSVPLVMLASLLALPFLGTAGVETSWLLILPVQLIMRRITRAQAGAADGERQTDEAGQPNG